MESTESKISFSSPWILFGLLIFLCLVVGGVLFLEEPSDSQGYSHGEKGTMRQGGTGERHSQILWWGAAFGILQILFSVGCLFFGMSRRSRSTQGKGWAFLVGSLLYSGVFLIMILTYRSYVCDPSKLVLSLPVPTAVMLLVLWPFPLYFVLLYSLKFDHWVFGKQDQDRFQELLRASRKPPEENR